MAEERVQSRVWLVNGQSVTVLGDIEKVKNTLDQWQGFAPLTREADRVYVQPQHVTHIEDALPEPQRR
jgi:hypothetical protein